VRGRHGGASRLPGATAGTLIAVAAVVLAIVGTAVLMALVSQ
jgi:hypothetical protein